MSMPQYLVVAVISCRPLVSAEVAVAVASLLWRYERGIQPELIAVACDARFSWRLTTALNARGSKVIMPQLPTTVDPKRVDLWLAADDEGETIARVQIEETGPLPERFYRSYFGDPIARFRGPSFHVPDPPSSGVLEPWLDDLQVLTQVWQERLWQAFSESS